MAVYRIHKKEWEKGNRPLPTTKGTTSTSSTPPPTLTKAKRTVVDAESESESDSDKPSMSKTIPPTVKLGKKRKRKDSLPTFPGGGRKGVSSGLSTVVKKVVGVAHGSGSTTNQATSKRNFKTAGGGSKSEWWKQLPGGVAVGGGAKASITVGLKR